MQQLILVAPAAFKGTMSPFRSPKLWPRGPGGPYRTRRSFSFPSRMGAMGSWMLSSRVARCANA